MQRQDKRKRESTGQKRAGAGFLGWFKNGWRLAFLVLLGLIIGSGVWFGATILTPYENTTTQSAPKRNQDPAFTVSLTKRQVNRIVDYYLSDFQKDQPVKYGLTVGDQAVLSGTFTFFGSTIKFGLTFDPLVEANGDVTLKARSLNVGSLGVPISYVLGYVGRVYKLPSWVQLNSRKETVVLKLSEFKLANGMSLRATKIDLPNDQINFAVYLPKTGPKPEAGAASADGSSSRKGSASQSGSASKAEKSSSASKSSKDSSKDGTSKATSSSAKASSK